MRIFLCLSLLAFTGCSSLPDPQSDNKNTLCVSTICLKRTDGAFKRQLDDLGLSYTIESNPLGDNIKVGDPVIFSGTQFFLLFSASSYKSNSSSTMFLFTELEKIPDLECQKKYEGILDELGKNFGDIIPLRTQLPDDWTVELKNTESNQSYRTIMSPRGIGGMQAEWETPPESYSLMAIRHLSTHSQKRQMCNITMTFEQKWELKPII